MKVSVRPRLKLRAVAAGMMAPELVCWPMSSKNTCRKGLSMCLEWQAMLHSWDPAFSTRKDCKGTAVRMASRGTRVRPFLLERPSQICLPHRLLGYRPLQSLADLAFNFRGNTVGCETDRPP